MCCIMFSSLKINMIIFNFILNIQLKITPDKIYYHEELHLKRNSML
jgi:hypothetical protein